MLSLSSKVIATLLLLSVAACTKTGSGNSTNETPAVPFDPNSGFTCAQPGVASNSAITDANSSGLVGYWETPGRNDKLPSETGLNSLFYLIVRPDKTVTIVSTDTTSDHNGDGNRHADCLPKVEVGTLKMTGVNAAGVVVSEDAIAKARAEKISEEEIDKARNGEAFRISIVAKDQIQMKSKEGVVTYRRAPAKKAAEKIEKFIEMTALRSKAVSDFLAHVQGRKLNLVKEISSGTGSKGDAAYENEMDAADISESYTSKDTAGKDIEVPRAKTIEFLGSRTALINAKTKVLINPILYEDGRFGLSMELRIDDKLTMTVTRGAVVESGDVVKFEDKIFYFDDETQTKKSTEVTREYTFGK